MKQGNPLKNNRSINCEPFTGISGVLKLRLLSLLCLTMTFILLMTSCSIPQTATYPDVSFPDMQDETESLIKSEPSVTSVGSEEEKVIRVAAPISSETAKYLSLLYAAKKQGLFPKGETGSTIKTDFLMTIEPNLWLKQFRPHPQEQPQHGRKLENRRNLSGCDLCKLLSPFSKRIKSCRSTIILRLSLFNT